MSSNPSQDKTRFRKNVEDAAVFGVAVVLSVGAILQFGVVGLGGGCVILSVAAAVVVLREDGRAEETDEGDLAADGGFKL